MALGICPECGQYSNYQGPELSGVSGFGNAVMMVSSTTGIESGGVVRAIFAVNTIMKQRDRIGYADPNVPCPNVQAEREAQWFYGHVVNPADPTRLAY